MASQLFLKSKNVPEQTGTEKSVQLMKRYKKFTVLDGHCDYIHSQKACVKRTQACVQVNTKLVSYINNTSLCEYNTSACVRQIFYTSIVLGSHNFCVGFPQVLCYCHHKFVQWRIQDFIVWGRMPSRSLLFRFTVLPYPFASLTLHSFPPLTCSEYVHQL